MRPVAKKPKIGIGTTAARVNDRMGYDLNSVEPRQGSEARTWHTLCASKLILSRPQLSLTQIAGAVDVRQGWLSGLLMMLPGVVVNRLSSHLHRSAIFGRSRLPY